MTADQDDGDVRALRAYCRFHGRRGPQTAGYVVTVTTPTDVAVQSPRPASRVKRHPVDTLEDAQETAVRLIWTAKDPLAGVADPIPSSSWTPWDQAVSDALHLGEDGGSVTLPNGSTISVERVPDWSDR